MCDVKQILQAEELENKYKRFSLLAQKIECKLEAQQEKCKHKIVIFTEYQICYGGYDDNLFQKCLFCGKETASRQSFYGSKVIDVSDSKRMEFLDRREKFELVKQLYIKTAIKNQELSSDEVQKLVEEEIANPGKEFWELKHTIYFGKKQYF